jgi:hypothetical protein
MWLYEKINTSKKLRRGIEMKKSAVFQLFRPKKIEILRLTDLDA